jgi:hypothetical protein
MHDPLYQAKQIHMCYHLGQKDHLSINNASSTPFISFYGTVVLTIGFSQFPFPLVHISFMKMDPNFLDFVAYSLGLHQKEMKR